MKEISSDRNSIFVGHRRDGVHGSSHPRSHRCHPSGGLGTWSEGRGGGGVGWGEEGWGGRPYHGGGVAGGARLKGQEGGG